MIFNTLNPEVMDGQRAWWEAQLYRQGAMLFAVLEDRHWEEVLYGPPRDGIERIIINDPPLIEMKPEPRLP